MRIAVNARFLSTAYREGFGNFIYEIFSRLVAANPGHEFLFIYDRPFQHTVFTGTNTKTIISGPPARHPLLWKLWYDITIPRLLRSHKADVFVSMDGFCSLRTRVPQCLVIHDLAYQHFPEHIPRSHLSYYKKYTPRFARKAASLVTVSGFSRRDIANSFGIPQEQVAIVPNGVRKCFRVFDVDEKASVREKFTGGKEYFVYTGAIHPRKNLLNLLKAFSLFKKRQHTGMKLVIAGRMAWKNDDLLTKLKTYRYRDDVVVTGYLADEDLAGITSAAYAMVYPSLFEGFGVPVIEAMHAGTPVITSSGTAMMETGGDAALYASPEDPAEIAEQMMLIYKNENLRNELIRKGLARAELFTWEEAATRMWACIQSAVK